MLIRVIVFFISQSDQATSWVLTGLLAVPLFGLGVSAYNGPVYDNSKQRFFTVVEEWTIKDLCSHDLTVSV